MKGETDVKSEKYKASSRRSAPLNGAPYQTTWESCIQHSGEERTEMEWPAKFEVWSNMSSSHLAKKLKAEDSLEITTQTEGGSISLFDNVYKAQKEKPLPLPARSQEQNILKEWKLSEDYQQFCTRTKKSIVADLMKILTTSSIDSLEEGETDMWAQTWINHASDESWDLRWQPTNMWVSFWHTYTVALTDRPFVSLRVRVHVSRAVGVAFRQCLFESMYNPPRPILNMRLEGTAEPQEEM